MLALYVAGRLSQQGVAVGFADSNWRAPINGNGSPNSFGMLAPHPLRALKRRVIQEVDRLREETAKYRHSVLDLRQRGLCLRR